jgi:hypothetical protein
VLYLNALSANPHQAILDDLKAGSLRDSLIDLLAALRIVFGEQFIDDFVIRRALSEGNLLRYSQELAEPLQRRLADYLPSSEALVVAYLTGPGVPNPTTDPEGYEAYREALQEVTTSASELALWVLIRTSDRDIGQVAERAGLHLDALIAWLAGEAELRFHDGCNLAEAIAQPLRFVPPLRLVG